MKTETKNRKHWPEIDEAYLAPPQLIGTPDPAHSARTRHFQGIPSIACGPDGRLWAVWYGGHTPAEDENNYVVLASSEDDGLTWSDEKFVIDPDGPGPVRAFDPEVWLAPDGTLWLFWAQGLGYDKFGTRSGVWAVTARYPDSGDPAWSEPRRLTDGVMMCKPLVLSTGEWCLPVSRWSYRAHSAAVYVSNDTGRTWTPRGACDVPTDVRIFNEHMIIERRDGTVRMLVRTRYGIGESVSVDSCKTWSPLRDTGITHPSSRFFIRRLQSGRVLFVRHNPEPTGTDGTQMPLVRSHLTAFLSDDDGATWPYSLLLDDRLGVSYPDGDQSADGRIFVVYDHRRTEDREILMAAFDENDIIAGTLNRPESRVRVVVNKAG